jgi:hypothetical protein
LSIKVTFDSNAWQRVVRPNSFLKDPRHSDFQKIHDAVKNGSVVGFISETVGTLEAVQKKVRPTYFGRSKPAAVVTPTVGGASISLGPNHSAHPGLAPILSDVLKDAVALGLRLLSAPRIGMPRPPEFMDANGNPDPAIFVTLAGSALGTYQSDFFAAERSIGAKGVGGAIVEQVAGAIQQRVGGSVKPWFEHLGDAATPAEIKAVAAGVAEWADGDAVASHIAIAADHFCTEDTGVGAGVSILDVNHRQWLHQTYGVSILDLRSLAALL